MFIYTDDGYINPYIVPMSSRTRQRLALYQVQWRDQIDTLFYGVCFGFSHNFFYPVVAFELWRLDILWKMISLVV